MSAGAYRHLDSLSALLPRVASVRTAADLEAVLPTVAAIAREASGATCVTIVLRSPGGGIEPVAFHGPEHLREALAGSEDTVWVALTDTDGTPLGHLGASGLAEEQSSILAAVAAYGAQALRRARASIAATRHRAALEALMRLRAGFDVRDGVDGLLAAVADAVRGTLGYHRVAIELGEDAIGWEQAVVMPLQAGDRRLGVLVGGADHKTGP
jgi:hypothetical protein